MSDYDNEFHKCLDKGKSIKNKIHKKSENNNNNNTQSVHLDNIIKESLEEFSKMIKKLNYFTTGANISNQELSRRSDNNKKLEEMLLQFQSQLEIDQGVYLIYICFYK